MSLSDNSKKLMNDILKEEIIIPQKPKLFPKTSNVKVPTSKSDIFSSKKPNSLSNKLGGKTGEKSKSSGLLGSTIGFGGKSKSSSKTNVSYSKKSKLSDVFRKKPIKPFEKFLRIFSIKPCPPYFATGYYCTLRNIYTNLYQLFYRIFMFFYDFFLISRWYILPFILFNLINTSVKILKNWETIKNKLRHIIAHPNKGFFQDFQSSNELKDFRSYLISVLLSILYLIFPIIFVLIRLIPAFYKTGLFIFALTIGIIIALSYALKIILYIVHTVSKGKSNMSFNFYPPSEEPKINKLMNTKSGWNTIARWLFWIPIILVVLWFFSLFRHIKLCFKGMFGISRFGFLFRKLKRLVSKKLWKSILDDIKSLFTLNPSKRDLPCFSL